MKKKFYKILAFVLAFLSFTTIVSVDGLGYTYDHKGNVIYSTEGLTVNQTPFIYSDFGIDDMGKLNNPTDIFVYKNKRGGANEEVVYLLDGGSTAKEITATLFILNDELKLQSEFNHFVYNPNNFSDEVLLAAKSSGKFIVSNASSGGETGGEGTEGGEGAEGGEETTNLAAKATIDNGFASLEELRANDLVSLYISGASAVYRSYREDATNEYDYLYICDTGNNQVLVIDYDSYDVNTETFEIVNIITSPTEELGTALFRPSKVIVDGAGRIYIIATDVRDGIMEFSLNTKTNTYEFNRYIGTNYKKMSAWDIFWRNFSTESQLSGQNLILQTSFTGMAYKNSMIYATSYCTETNDIIDDTAMIKKINPSGKDVLRRNGYTVPKGDFKYHRSNDGYPYNPSTLECIAVNDYGVYTVVDSNRDRLFTYDNEGNLLYISGGTGTQVDKISNPKAIQYFGENLLVLDGDKKALLMFEPTDIAKVINKAIECEFNGNINDETLEDGTVVYGAAHYWEQVIELNANYEYAYVGIGKKYMNDKDYKTAMYYFELGFDAEYYGKAYKQYRDGIIKRWFAPVVVTLIVLFVGLYIYKKIRRKKLGIKEEEITGIGDE